MLLEIANDVQVGRLQGRNPIGSHYTGKFSGPLALFTAAAFLSSQLRQQKLGQVRLVLLTSVNATIGAVS